MLIAGDLFHRQPLLKELRELNYLFSKLSKTKVVFIAGNHDYIKPNSQYLSFEWANNVFPLLGDEMQYVEFPELSTCVYGFSYHSREIREPRLHKVYAMRKQPYEILLGHGGDEKHIPFQKRNLQELGYDYIALGHIHKPQKIDEEKIRFAGAPEPLDKNEVGAHGYVLGKITERGVRSKFISDACREYIHIKVAVEESMTGFQLHEKINRIIDNMGIQNMYKIMLQGLRAPEVEFDLNNMNSYGNILEIVDETCPSYDFEKMKRENEGNLLGKFIEKLEGAEEGSVAALALYEGVQAILKAKG